MDFGSNGINNTIEEKSVGDYTLNRTANEKMDNFSH